MQFTLVECYECGTHYTPSEDSELYMRTKDWYEHNKGIYVARFQDSWGRVECPWCLSRIHELYLNNVPYINRMVAEGKLKASKVRIDEWTVSDLLLPENGLYVLHSNYGIRSTCFIKGRFENDKGTVAKGFRFIKGKLCEKISKRLNLPIKNLQLGKEYLDVISGCSKCF